MGKAGAARLLYWTEFFWPTIGGVETYAKQFIPALRERGYEVVVVTVRQYDYPEEESVDGVSVYRLPFHEVLRSRDPEDFIKLRRQVEAIRNDFAPDLVHANLYGPSIAMHLETNRRTPVPSVIAIHSDFSQTGVLGGIVQRAFDQAAWVTAVSQATLGDIRGIFPQINDKSSCIHNGLVTENIEPAPLSADPPRVLCIGRLINEKGFDVALDAFASVRKSFPNATLTIAGQGTERPALEQQAEALGLGESVTFAGWVKPDAVYDLVSQSTVMLVPSRWREPFGIVAIEAALMARPVIAARTGGLAEVVIDGKTGFLVDKEDPAALAERLREVLSKPELAAKLGKNARADMLKRFSMDANVAAYDALYRRVLAARQA
ncbi:MAG: glycosyltransferase family 4 protein [Alphaproteobacteria bacterium]